MGSKFAGEGLDEAIPLGVTLGDLGKHLMGGLSGVLFSSRGSGLRRWSDPLCGRHALVGSLS